MLLNRGNRRPLIERRPALLVCHLEEEQKRQLLRALSPVSSRAACPEQRRRIIAACLRAARKQVRQAVIAQDVAIIPELLNVLLGHGVR
jgi:hypothetical protein